MSVQNNGISNKQSEVLNLLMDMEECCFNPEISVNRTDSGVEVLIASEAICVDVPDMDRLRRILSLADKTELYSDKKRKRACIRMLIND